MREKYAGACWALFRGTTPIPGRSTNRECTQDNRLLSQTKPSRGKKDLNKIRPTSTRKRNLVPRTYREDSTTIIDDEETKTEEESGFVSDLETHD